MSTSITFSCPLLASQCPALLSQHADARPTSQPESPTHHAWLGFHQLNLDSQCGLVRLGREKLEQWRTHSDCNLDTEVFDREQGRKFN
jgi:hypothetical protein